MVGMGHVNDTALLSRNAVLQVDTSETCIYIKKISYPEWLKHSM